jgi:2-oxoglutarate ferredoxin oxidoreductase subunit alpha
MTERVVIPPAEAIRVVPRRLTARPPGDYQPYQRNGALVPEFARAGDGYRFHTTGLTHDERGYPVMTADCQARCVPPLRDKLLQAADRIMRLEEDGVDGADVVVVAYGITARVAQMGAQLARADGVKVGTLRLITAWPFPEARIRALAGQVRAFVVPEINSGQIVLEVERCAAGRTATIPVSHAGGSVHDPEQIRAAIAGGAA